MLKDEIASRLAELRKRGARVSYAAVARELGCCARWVKVVDLRMREGRTSRRYQKWTRERAELLSSLIELGYQVKVVARWAGVNASYLSQVFWARKNFTGAGSGRSRARP